MQTICRSHFLQQVYRKIEGAVLDSQNERNLDCVTTFQTHSILQRFMIHFDRLQLDCNDHLFIYDGAHAVGAHKVKVLCSPYTRRRLSPVRTKQSPRFVRTPARAYTFQREIVIDDAFLRLTSSSTFRRLRQYRRVSVDRVKNNTTDAAV